MTIWSQKGKLRCRSALVQTYESSSCDDMDVELEVSLGIFVGDDDMGGLEWLL